VELPGLVFVKFTAHHLFHYLAESTNEGRKRIWNKKRMETTSFMMMETRMMTMANSMTSRYSWCVIVYSRSIVVDQSNLVQACGNQTSSILFD
jgi:hypothetical protein